jgi:hypothetical protein
MLNKSHSAGDMGERDPIAAAAQRFRPIQSAMPGTTLGPIQIDAFSGGGVLTHYFGACYICILFDFFFVLALADHVMSLDDALRTILVNLSTGPTYFLRGLVLLKLLLSIQRSLLSKHGTCRVYMIRPASIFTTGWQQQLVQRTYLFWHPEND